MGDAISIKSINEKCNVCCDKLSDAVLMDCGHGGICYECACTLIKVDERCHFCRNQVSSILQIDTAQHSINYLKVITVTVIDCEQGTENIDNVVMMLNNEESNYPDEYNSLQKYTR